MNAADVGTSGISVILSQNETSGSDTPLTPGYSSSFLSTGDYLFHTINSLTPASEYTFKAVASYQSIPSDPSYVSACTCKTYWIRIVSLALSQYRSYSDFEFYCKKFLNRLNVTLLPPPLPLHSYLKFAPQFNPLSPSLLHRFQPINNDVRFLRGIF